MRFLPRHIDGSWPREGRLFSPVYGAFPRSGSRPAVYGGLARHIFIEPRLRGFSLFGFSQFAIWIPSNYYAEINLHMVWHTKESSPLLTPRVEAIVHHEIRGRCIKTPGVFIREIGGIETHVHVCVSIAPIITVSDLIGQLKGGSSHDANQKLGRKLLEWQNGYGVVSFGTRDLEWVKSYVKNQRDRHSRGQMVDRLESITTPADTAEAEQREAP